jgi:hypothetical protein
MTQEEFNEKFRDLFSGMIQVAFEYVNRNTEEVDAVYVYVAMEGPSNFYNIFYKINNQFVEMHEVNSVSNIQYDTAVKRMMDVLKLGTGDVAEMRALFEEFQGQVPTQMKMIFEPKTDKFDNDISYDLFHSNNSEKTNADIFEEWFEEMK